MCQDVYYPTTASFPSGTWQAGTYTLALTENGNPGIGNLSDGFFAENIAGIAPGANFTCQVGPVGFQGTPPSLPVDGPFCDQFDPSVERTGAWSLDFINVDSATEIGSTPEPGTFAMFVIAGIGLAVWSRRRLAPAR